MSCRGESDTCIAHSRTQLLARRHSDGDESERVCLCEHTLVQGDCLCTGDTHGAADEASVACGAESSWSDGSACVCVCVWCGVVWCDVV